MNFEINGPLTSRKGQRVTFGPPADIAKAGRQGISGTIADEVWAEPELNDSPARERTSEDDWGDYSFCAQLIHWDDGSRSIRLAYFRRRPGENKWRFAAQTTVCSHPATIKSLLEQALAKFEWFSSTQ